jgi:hypothetical protein
MQDFSRGVSFYTKGTVEIGFPEDKVCCDYCPMLETYARKQCRRTGEYLVNTRTIGFYCPLEFLGEVDTNDEQNN